MKPIAGLNQFPFIIGGLQVTAAKIDGQVFVNELYVIKQRSFDSFDLISDDFKVYKYIRITGKSKDRKLLNYNDDDKDIADSLENNTFCIKEADAINNKYGFGIQYQSNKIKLHNGEIIFRRTNLKPHTLSNVVIKPDNFTIYSNDKMNFTAYFTPSDWSDQSGTWSYPPEHLSKISSDKNNITLQAGSIDGDIPIEISFTPTSNSKLKATAHGHLHDDPNVLFGISLTPNPINVKLNDTFTVSVVYDPDDYASDKRGGTWSGYNTNVLKVVSEDKNSITFKAIAVLEDVHPTTSVLFTLNEDKTKTADATIDITYAELENVELKPSSVDDKAGVTGSIEIIYTPDNAKQGGTWTIDDPKTVKSTGSRDTEYDYKLLTPGKTKATFTPSAEYKKDKPFVDFTVEYSDLKSVTLTPNTVSNIKPDETGKIDITYDPETAEKGGTWTFDPTGIVVEDKTKSTDDVMYYIAKKQGTTTATFTPKGGADPKTVKFSVLYSDLTSIVLTPDSETVKIDDDFEVKITYVPDTAKHEGSWNTSAFSDYVTLDTEKSTPDVAYFKAIKATDKIELIYTEGKISATNTCTINYQDTKSITIKPLNPNFTYMTVGDVAFIQITYNPDKADHTGTWDYNKEYFEYQGMDPESKDVARFLAIDSTDEDLPFIYKSDNISSNTIKAKVPYVPPQILYANPSKVIAPVGSDFYIDITYDPVNSVHEGIWYYNDVYLKKLDDSTPDKAHFLIIEKSPLINMSYQNGEATAAYVTVDSSHDPLTGVTLSPTSEIAPLGTTFDIHITYEPDTAYHFGAWIYDHEYLEHLNEGDYEKGTFKVIKKSPTPLTLTYKSVGHSATNTCDASYDLLTGITLSPESETVPLGKSFDLDITYIPDSAQHIGEWEYDKTYLQYNEDKSVQYEKGNFTVIKKSDKPLTITYKQGEVKGNSICDAKYDSLVDFTMSPESETVPLGQTFTIDITYNPDSAQHIGTWDYDKEYLELLNPTDFDKPQFKVLKKSDKPLTISFTSSGITHTNTCDARFDLLTSVSLNPESEEVLNGDTFTIDISYTPDTAQHIGTWEYDTNLIQLVEPIDYDKQQFKVLKRFDTPTILRYTSTNNKSAENKCTATYDKLNSIKLSPENETVSVGDVFDIAITYDPSTAEHKGSWKYDKTYLELDTSKSTPDLGVFKVLAKPSKEESAQQIVYTSADKSAENTCNILYDELKSVTLDPVSENSAVGETFKISITYDPETALETGTWDYDKEQFEYLASRSGYKEAYFKVLKESDKEHKLIYTSADKSATNTWEPYPTLQEIKLSPAYEEVFPDDEFEVDITYVPDTAEHTGSWRTELGDTGEDADEYVQLLPKSTPDKAYFKALKLMPTESIKLIYTSADKSATNICDIFFDRLTGIVLDPTHETVKGGDSFKIKITYVPDTAEHVGEWDLDHNYFNEEDDSTKDLAHFTVVDYTPEVQTLTYTSAGISAKNECTITPIELKSINLSPSSESVKALDEFFIDITYDPPASDHTGAKWNTDEFKEYVELLPDSTDKRAHFKALKRSEKPINLTLSKDSVSATNTCNIDYSDLKDISITYDPDFKKLPGEQYILGDKFTANITFIPDTAEHKEGVWKFNDAEGCARIDSQDIQSTKFTSIKTTPSNFRKLPTYTVGDISKETFFVIGYADLTELKLSPEDFPSTLVNKRVGPITTTYSPSTASISSAQWDGDLDYVIGLSGTNTTTSYVVAKKDTIPGGNKIRKKCIVNTNKPDEFIYSNYIIVNATSSPLESFIIKTDNKADPSTVEMKLYQNATITVVNTPSNAIYNGTWDVEDKSYFLVAGPNQLNNTYSLVANKESDKPIKVTYTEGGVAKHVTITKITK